MPTPTVVRATTHDPMAARVPAARPDRADLASRVVIAAAGIGVAGDVLLRAGGLGVNLTILALLLLAALAALAARAGRLRTSGSGLIIVAALFAAGFSLRASGALAFLNLLGFVTTLAVLAANLASRGRWSVRGARIGDYAAALVRSAAQAALGAPSAVLEGVRGGALTPRWITGSGEVRVLIRALALTAPVLLVFTSLLSAADPAFAQLIGNTLHFDLGAVAGHVALAALIAWPVAGYARGAVLGRRGSGRVVAAYLPRVGITEVTVALGSLDALFLTFVGVQLRYLFGGDTGLRVAGLTYAEYARRGFFELVWVVALVLPVLLIARELLGRVPARAERVYRGLAGTTLVLVLMIVASAMQRMWMYQVEFGLTELRLYASVFMGWIVAVLGLFALTVLQGRTRGLAFGALSSGWAVIAALNLVNPDALIVRVNAARLAHGRPFDVAYAARLSDDAVPALAALLPGVHRDDERCGLAQRLVRPAWRLERESWKSWNLGRERARRAGLRAVAAVLPAAQCGPLGDEAAWREWYRRRFGVAPGATTAAPAPDNPVR